MTRGLHHGGSGEEARDCLDSAKVTTFPNGLDVRCERQKVVKVDFKVLVQARMMVLPLTKMGTTGKAALG